MNPASVLSMLRSNAGAVTPMAALTLAAMIGFAGLVTDVGVWYVQRRNLQSATDAAALAAANRPADATEIAKTLLASNGFAATNLVSAEAGFYCPNAGVAVSARFSSSSCDTGDETPSAPNAVRLQAQTTGPALLTRVLGGTGRNIRTTAIAARVDEAGLTVASGLVSANLSIANATLQSLLGGSGLNLSAVQYNGLLSTNVDAKLFFNALAANLGVSAGTYSQLLQSQAKVGDVLQASIDALNQQSSVSDVSAAVAGLQAIKAKVTGSTTISLGKLFDLGIWRDQAVGSSGAPAALEAGLNAYQVATFALQLANGSHAVTIPGAGLNIPGVLGVVVQATAIEPPQTSYFAFGPKDVSVHTAQVRLQLAVQVAPPLLEIPLYVEAAHGDATLADIQCGTDPANNATVTVRAKTGVASVYIGTPSSNAMTNFSAPVTVSPAPLLQLAGVTLGASVSSTAGASDPTILTFTQPPASGIPANMTLSTQGYMARLASANGPPASPGWPAQVVSSGMLGGLSSSLGRNIGNADLSVCVGSICLTPLVGLVKVLVAPLLGSALSLLVGLVSSLDPIIDGLLESLGVKLGTTEVLVTGLRCGVPVLIG